MSEKWADQDNYEALKSFVELFVGLGTKDWRIITAFQNQARKILDKIDEEGI